MTPYILLLRPHHYIKNLFVLAPFLFTFEYNLESLSQAILIFMLFCLLASSVYIFNDLRDIESDKQHPEKRFRPLASGIVNNNIAISMMIALACISLLSTAAIDPNISMVFVFYMLLNIAYSLRLKHFVLIDIFIISIGFVLRVFAGSIAIQVQPSAWIIIMTFLLALFLAIAKRRDDILLASLGKTTRKNIDGYNLELVNASMIMMAAIIIVSYILYTVSPEITSRMHSTHLYLTAGFVILGIMRYMQLTFVEEKSGSPTNIILTDRFMQWTLLSWLATFLAIVLL